MLKEKFIKIFKEDGNNKKKTENLIFLLILLIVTVVAINMIWNNKENTSNNIDPTRELAVEANENRSNETTLETKLENILSKISGVGNVEVMITYNETKEIVPIYNTENKTSVTNETDSTGRDKNCTTNGFFERSYLSK